MFETRSRLNRIWLTVITAVLVVPFVIPLFTMIHGSLQGSGWGNYLSVIQLSGFWLYFRNSIIISVGTIALVYILTMTASFGFSKLRIRNKEIYFWLMMGALTMPEVVLLTPLVIAASKTGTGGTFWAVIIPLVALQIPFTVLLARSYVDGVPDALFEAARIDGAGTARQFWNILLPLVLLGQSEGHMVVTQLPNSFKTQYTDDQTKILAGAVLAALPEIIAYIALQRHFERGMAAGAIK